MAAVDTTMLKDRANGFLAGFSIGQKAVVVIAVITLVAGGVFFATWAAKPTLVPLYSNLSGEDASAITTELTAKGIPYELGNGGGTVMVAQADLYQARLDLAGKGLPAGGSQGYKLLDKQGITTSDFKQRVDYQRALEGEISRTIGSINGVQAATVHLVIPKDDVFANDAKKPTASVLVKTAPGKNLADPQVQSIVNLTASAVEGLSPADVTVADGAGRLLSSNGQVGGSSTDSQLTQTNAMQDDLTRKVQALLTPLVGEGKAVVQARAELNFDKSTETSEVFNPDNKPANPSSQRKTTETMINGVVTDGSCLTNGTIPPGCIVQGPDAAGGQNQNYVKTDEAQDNNQDRKVTQTEKAPGTIERVTVAVLLDANVPNIDAARIEALVTQAAGLQAARGDAVTVERMPFDKTQANAAADELKAAEKAASQEALMGYIKTGATFLIILAVLALLFITTKKRANTYRPQPLSLAELEAAMPVLPSADEYRAELDSQRSALELDTPEAKERAQVDQDITDLIERQPDEVAGLLRSWLADRRS